MQLNEMTKMYREALITTKALIMLSQCQLTGLQKNDLAKINEVIQKQNLLLKTFAEQEKNIIRIQKQIAKELGYEEFKVEFLNSYISEESYKLISNLQKELLVSLKDLKQINDLNNQINRQNLSYIQNIVQAVNQFSNQPGNRTYSQKGQVQRDEDSSLINKRV